MMLVLAAAIQIELLTPPDRVVHLPDVLVHSGPAASSTQSGIYRCSRGEVVEISATDVSGKLRLSKLTINAKPVSAKDRIKIQEWLEPFGALVSAQVECADSLGPVIAIYGKETRLALPVTKIGFTWRNGELLKTP